MKAINFKTLKGEFPHVEELPEIFNFLETNGYIIEEEGTEPKRWFERLDEGTVMCFVSDHDSKPAMRHHNKIALICERSNGLFYDVSGTSWWYATPLSQEQLEKFLSTHKQLGI